MINSHVCSQCGIELSERHVSELQRLISMERASGPQALAIRCAVISFTLLASLASAQNLNPAIRSAPAPERYVPFGAYVPPMVLRDSAGNIHVDWRTDKQRVARLWKAFKHRPTLSYPSDSYGQLWVNTWWNIPANWSGNLTTCDPGHIYRGMVDASVRQLNWYRSMAGVWPVAVNPNASAEPSVQSAALVTRMGYAVTQQGTPHNPPPSTPCYSSDAASAARASLISVTFGGQPSRGPLAIDNLIDDVGPQNYVAGHRRSMLSADDTSTFYGEVITTEGAGLAADSKGAATLLMTPKLYNQVSGSAPEVMWPPPGYFPYHALPWQSGRWHMSCDGCDFAGANVSVTMNGAPLSVRLETFEPTFPAQPALVWQVSGIDYSTYEPRDLNVFTREDIFDVAVSYRQNGQAKSKSYRVIAFNPDLVLDNVPPWDVTDMFWVPAESGWGVALSQGMSGNLFVTVYIYDAQGKSRWLVASGGEWPSRYAFTGKLYEAHGPGIDGPFDPSRVSLREVGTLQLHFADDTETAVMTTIIDGVQSVKQVQRYTNVPQAFADGMSYRGIWWNPGESGWGFSVSQRYGTLFNVLYAYRPDGTPQWVVMPGGEWSSEFVYEGDLFTATQKPWNPAAFDPASTTLRSVGRAKLTFETPEKGTLEYSIDGAQVKKAIERYAF